MGAPPGLTCARHDVTVDVAGAGPPGVARLGARIVFVPELLGAGPSDAPVVFCWSGGGMSLSYFDLQVSETSTPAERDTYSCASFLARRGCVVVCVDHPGIGGSDRPDDAWDLSPWAVAATEVDAVNRLLDLLRDGVAAAGLTALTPRTVVGLGHSMGAMLVVCQQAAGAPYDAIALLGHSGRGLIDQLNETEARFSDDPDGLRRHLRELSVARFLRPLPGSGTSVSEWLSGRLTPASRSALSSSGAPLLAVCGLASMIPGSHGPELAAVAVPVFTGVGEHDICGPVDGLADAFPAAADVTAYVLAGSAHNHNVAANREDLWSAVLGWLTGLATSTVP